MKRLTSLYFHLTTLSFVILAGCSTSPREQTSSGTEEIIVTRDLLPKSCKFRGQISGSSTIIPFTGIHASQDEAMNDMKNKASALGANFIHIETGAGNIMEWKILGNAFKCPEGTVPGQRQY